MNIAKTFIFSCCLLGLISVPLLADSSCEQCDKTPCASCEKTPANTSMPHTLSVGLAGYSPVSYLDDRRAEPGSPRYRAEHDGVTYFFTSTAQRKRFLANPARYLPAYGGYCAFGCSIEKRFVPDPTQFKIIDGRTHLFLKNDEVDARKLWEDGDASQLTTKADAYWEQASKH